jgi:cell division protein FtsB
VDPKKQFLIGAAVAAALVLLFGPGFVRWAELKSQRAQFKAEIDALKEQNRRLYEEARRLREDPAYAEQVYRREMGVVRPGETVIKFRKGQKSEKAVAGQR